MKSLAFDALVTRVTKNKERAIVKVRELEVGDVFVHDRKRWGLVTQRLKFSDCDGGDRVRYRGHWYIVWRHGRENVIFPLPNNDPFSKWESGKNTGDFPFPLEEVQFLAFREFAEVAASETDVED